MHLAPLLLPTSRSSRAQREEQCFASEDEHDRDLKSTLEDGGYGSSSTCPLSGKGRWGHAAALTWSDSTLQSRDGHYTTVTVLQLKAGISESLLIPVGTNHEMPRIWNPVLFMPPN